MGTCHRVSLYCADDNEAETGVWTTQKPLSGAWHGLGRGPGQAAGVYGASLDFREAHTLGRSERLRASVKLPSPF